MNPLSIFKKQIGGALFALLMLFTISTAQTNPDDTYWHDGFQQPGVDNAVRAMIEFDGKAVVGGSFVTAGGVTVNHVATWDGEHWAKMGGGLDVTVMSLIIYNGVLIAGGGKILPGGIDVGLVAAWNGSSWVQLGGVFDGYVYALTIYQDKLIAGGEFTLIDTLAVNCVAAWDGTAWSPVGVGPSGTLDPFGIAPPSARHLTVFENNLIAAGNFKYAGADTVYGIAQWNGSSWSSVGVDTLYVNSLFSLVTATAVYNNKLIIARQGSISGFSVTYLLAWNGWSWEEISISNDELPLRGTVSGFSVHNNELFVAGNFSVITASGDTFSKLIRWDGFSWEQVEGANTLQGAPRQVIEFDDVLLVGGSHTYVDGFYCRYIASYANGTWRPLGKGVEYSVLSSTVYHDKLVLGGNFTTAGGLPAAHIAAWDGSSWSSFGNGVQGSVKALAVYHDELVAAGSAFDIDSSYTTAPIIWDGVSWRLTSPLQTGMDDEVVALTVHDDKLIAGGKFTKVNGMTVKGLAAWSGSDWSTLGNDSNVLDRRVNCMVSDGERLFIGGYFHSEIFHTPTVTDLMVLTNNENWWIMGSYTPEIFAMSLYSNKPVAGNTGAIYRFTYTDWPVLETDVWNLPAIESSVIGSVLAFAEYDGKLVAGGGFDSIGGVAANNIAIWDGNSWAPLGSGVDGTVRTLTAYRDLLCVGGEFTHAGEKPSSFFAVWNKQTPTGTGDDPHLELPDGYQLSQNYPNPFNPSTQIEYDLPTKSQVTVTVYNLLGQKVRTLVDRVESAGIHTVEWDGRTDAGEKSATGMYLYRIEAGEFKQTKKMLLVK